MPDEEELEGEGQADLNAAEENAEEADASTESAEETIAWLQQVVAYLQTQHEAVLGRYVGLLRQRSDVIPEMVGGGSLAEVDKSMEASQLAFERVAERIRSEQQVGGANGVATESPKSFSVAVPAGGSRRRGREEMLAEEARRLDPVSKILLGLENK